ncbi:hypothetical protein AZF37_09070 [endosymbiont 'TC1' of Trimyema compressum]|uniref:hypothetical protein n=1 Tax=endosymbiont 'TC1' of Trimyema compressum TaxID=243899 RepID=UPI0007F179EB|nr:hypothetical protein [endosymbiont 'TC1' of Trimyema compressum]AMP21273.1 hypothetical protein AZF37_09070 [endosymbiont 'TC1' of Trimyema compressum]
MIKNLRHSFFQTFSLTFIWILGLLSIFTKLDFSFNFVWNIVAISLLSGLIFGTMHNAVWNFFTFKPLVNVLVTSIVSIIGGLSIVWLFSVEMFYLVVGWIVPMMMLSIVLHIIAFYFYSKSGSYRKIKELNSLIKGN